jgi:hypothetical protein
MKGTVSYVLIALAQNLKTVLWENLTDVLFVVVGLIRGETGQISFLCDGNILPLWFG